MDSELKHLTVQNRWIVLSKTGFATLAFYCFMQFIYVPLFTTTDLSLVGNSINPMLTLGLSLFSIGLMGYTVKQWINLYCYADLLTKGEPQ